MEELLIQLLGNSPTLAAVLVMYAKFDKRCALIEHELKNLWEEEKRCFFKS